MARPIPTSYYYSGQGQVVIGERDPSGKMVNAYAVGNCTALEIQVAVEKIEHKESMSGQRSVDKVLITSKTASFNITMESLDLRNLQLAFWGKVVGKQGGTVTAEKHPAKPGAIVTLDNVGVGSVVVTLDGGTPTPVPDTEYTVDDEFGTIQIHADSTTVPATNGVISVAYKFAPSDTLHALTEETQPERFVRFEGLNTLDGSRVLVEIPRAAFEPLQSLPLINEDFANVQMTGNILQDTKIATPGVSQFYRQTLLTSDWRDKLTP